MVLLFKLVKPVFAFQKYKYSIQKWIDLIKDTKLYLVAMADPSSHEIPYNLSPKVILFIIRLLPLVNKYYLYKFLKLMDIK